jgi:hypothetical protein
MATRRLAVVLALVALLSAVWAGSGSATPSAAEFADDFTGVANAYAWAHGLSKRIVDADCVQASPRHYMCAYAVIRPRAPRECHLMQAEWRPEALSTIKVTLSGRVAVCDSLAHALRSLR